MTAWVRSPLGTISLCGLVSTRKPLLFQIRDNLLAGVKTIQTLIFDWRQVVDPSIQSQNIERNELMALSHLVIIEVMRGGDFDAPRAEFGIDVGVGNNRNAAFA